MDSSSEILPCQEKITINEAERRLLTVFDERAFIKDYDKEYISVPFVNQLIDPELQWYAAGIIAYDIREKIRNNEVKILNKKGEDPTFKVVGVPDSGIYLATAVAHRLNWLLLPGRKGPNPPPGAWEDQFIIKEEVRSYTTGKMSSFAFNGLEEFDNILLIDDVIAQGYTGELIINKFREKNINVLGLGVYFDKIFQDGVYRIEKNTGVASFSVLRIEEIFDDGRINRQKARYYREEDIIPTP